MAVTDTNRDPALLPKFFGLSSDTKPARTPIGADFYETDTKRRFVFDGAEWFRRETVVVEQLEAVEVEEIRSTTVILEAILTQLQIQNVYLSRVTGEELDDTDIPAETA